jgi:hypothetical protein
MNKLMTETTSTPLRVSHNIKHPFAECFFDLGDHTAEDALVALSNTVKSGQRELNAYDWTQEALPGATMKPGHAIGTVGELHRKYTQGQEYIRFVGVLREAN